MSKRRQRGTGSIYKRGHLLWIQYYVDGVQFNESAHTEDRREAERLLAIKTGEVAAGKIRAETGRTLVLELLDDVIEDYKMTGKSSLKDAQFRIKNHLGPAFGNFIAMELGSSAITRYVNMRKKEEAANGTINRELALLKRAYSLGLSADPPKVHKALRFPMLKEDNVREGFLEQSEYEAMRDALPARVRLFLVAAYHLGMRRSELAAIQWSQVDLAAKQVRLSGRQTKNKSPRTAPLYGELLERIVMAKAERDQLYPDCQWVFAEDGKPMRDFRGVWEKAAKAIGKPDLLVHDLRRSAIRNMERAGIPRNVAMRISGHKTEAVYRRYDIISSRDVAAAGEKMERYMQAQAETEKTDRKRVM